MYSSSKCYKRCTVVPFANDTLLFPTFFQKYKELEKSVKVEEIDGVKLVKNLAVKMEEVFRKKADATRVGSILNMVVGGGGRERNAAASAAFLSVY